MQGKFKVGQLVKFKTDHDRMAGKVLSFSWDSEKGFVYTIASRYYDVTANDMLEGVKVCREDELVDMTNAGTQAPAKPAEAIPAAK